MPELVTVPVGTRSAFGKRAVRRLRTEGLVPGIVYGQGELGQAVQFSGHDFAKVVREGSRVVNLSVDGDTQTALIRDLQWDTFGIDILHVDFERINAADRVTVEIPLKLHGTAPGVGLGGSLNHVIHSLELECPAIAIPEEIRVDIQKLGLNEAIHMRDIQLPESATFEGDLDAVVVQVTEVFEQEEEEVTEDLGAAEPEVISKGGAEEKEE